MWLTYILGSLLHIQATHFVSLVIFSLPGLETEKSMLNKIMNYILDSKSIITT